METCAAIASTAETMYDMSGSFVLRSGVGTQMLTVSSPATTLKSVVAVSRPSLSSARTSADGTSGMYDSPHAMAAIFRLSRSIPVHVRPLRAKFDRQRKSDVAETDDADACPPVLNSFE